MRDFARLSFKIIWTILNYSCAESLPTHMLYQKKKSTDGAGSRPAKF